jgi:hypothetical protein
MLIFQESSVLGGICLPLRRWEKVGSSDIRLAIVRHMKSKFGQLTSTLWCLWQVVGKKIKVFPSPDPPCQRRSCRWGNNHSWGNAKTVGLEIFLLVLN